MQSLEALAYSDLVKAQMDIRKTGITAMGRGNYGNYVTLDALLDAVVPSLNAHNFFFTQAVEVRSDSKMYVVTRVKHTNGTSIELHAIQMGFSAIPKDIQKLGGEQTYLRKYGISSAFGLYGEQDDDGQSLADDSKREEEAQEESEEEERLSKEEANSIKQMLKGHPDILENILKMGQKIRVGDFEKSRYSGIVKYIEQEKNKKAE